MQRSTANPTPLALTISSALGICSGGSQLLKKIPRHRDHEAISANLFLKSRHDFTNHDIRGDSADVVAADDQHAEIDRSIKIFGEDVPFSVAVRDKAHDHGFDGCGRARGEQLSANVEGFLADLPDAGVIVGRPKLYEDCLGTEAIGCKHHEVRQCVILGVACEDAIDLRAVESPGRDARSHTHVVVTGAGKSSKADEANGSSRNSKFVGQVAILVIHVVIKLGGPTRY